MKMRKILSAAAALAVAATSAVVASAASVPTGCADSGMFACLLSDDANVPLFTDSSLVATIQTVSVTIKSKDKDFEAAVASGTEWYGGGFGFNSNSTGWKSIEWSIQDGIKDLTLVPTDTRYEYKITYTQDTPIFAATDEYAQCWIQDWTSSTTFELVSFELLNADGVDIRTLATDDKTDDEVAEDTAEEVVEDTAEEDTEEEDTYEEDTYEEDTYEEDTDEEDTYEEETETADDETETADDETETADDETAAADAGNTADKGSPDTGVAGVAAVAGAAALAGAAVVISRKRK